MVYAIYDTTSIQSYIFASTKLRENIGASKLVGQVFQDFLPKVLEATLGKDDVITDWSCEIARTVQGWKLEKTAEIIYVGGGNAYVAYKTVCDYEKATSAFLRKVYEETATIGIASAYVETDFTTGYPSQHKTLMQKLSQAKGEINRPIVAGSQAITKTSLLTGLPVTHVQNNELISQDQYLKRNVNKGGLETFDNLKRGRTSFLGVVHIDGNNVGRHIETYMNNGSEDWSAAVPKIREMSYRISKLYSEAYDAAETIFNDFYYSKRSEKYRSKNEPHAPLLKIIGDGDDITCVLTGLWSISFAAQLLREIESHGKRNDLYPFKDWPTGAAKPRPQVSACAGVVLFHSHYPFSEAYKMAEECCKNAKRYTRSADKHTNDVVGSFIDFHVHHGGAVSDLKSLRDKQYKIGKKALNHPPFCVLNPDGTEAETLALFENLYPSFCDFDNLIRNWTRQDSDNSWPRSRLKTLRDAISGGEAEVKKVLDWCKARGYTLPEGYESHMAPEDEEHQGFFYTYALLFNVLEFADIYENICKGVEK